MTLSTEIDMDKISDLIEYIGGKENIISTDHCITRLRFTLSNTIRTDIAAIKKLSFVKGCLINSGQFQIVIGTNVSEYYNAFIKQLDNEKGKMTSVSNSIKVSLLNQFIAYLADIFMPLLPALILGGVLLGIRNLIGDVAFIHNQPLMRSYPWLHSVYDFLWLPCEAIFYFLPVTLCWSAVHNTGGTQILGIILGLTLVSPQLVSVYDIGNQAQIPEFWDFGFFTIEKIGYQSQVIPTLLSGVTLSIIEIQLKKIVPAYLHLVLIPLVALIVTVLLAFAIIGPFGQFLGKGITHIIHFLMLSSFAPLGSAIFGFFYAPLVLTGMHHMTLTFDLQMTGAFGGTPLWPIIALSNVAQASAVLGLLWVNKNKKEREIMLPAAISAYLGVSEPAMYSVNLPRRFPMIGAMIGTSLAALICGINQVLSNGIGVGGLPSILSVQSSFWGIYLVALLIAIVVPLFLTVLVCRINTEKKQDCSLG